MFEYSLDNKRYHTLNYYYKNKYKKKVFKVPLNAGFGCPIIENGSHCIFCSHMSGDFAGNINDSLEDQFNKIKSRMQTKWKDGLCIVYFQVGTNTNAPLEILKEKFEKAISFPNVIGLNIGTRSDCISNEVLEYLCDLDKRTDLTIELGLQSIHDKTLTLIKRGHDFDNFHECFMRLKKHGLKVVVHIINSLPHETKKDMLETAKYINKIKPHGIKIHMLHILKNTPLAIYYKNVGFHVLSKEEYIDIVCDQLELLDKEIVIHRITGDPTKEELIAPSWLLKKFIILNDIDKEMKRRNSYQGIKCNY